jgi:Flp pilus assembly protein TadD
LTRASLAVCGALALLAGLLYINALHNPFVYDDYRTILDNGSIVSLTDMRAIVLHDASRPIVNLSYAIDRRIWGTAPFGFHVTGVLLHMLNVVLLFWLAWRVVEDLNHRSAPEPADPWPMRPGIVALVTASLFAVHPMMTEAVGYVSGRSEVLCATFFLAALLCARRWMARGGMVFWLLSVVFWLCALLTKEIAAMFPFVVLCYDRLLLNDAAAGRRRRLWRLHTPLFALAALAATARVAVFIALEHPDAFQIEWRSVLVELNVAARYLWLIVVPVGQTIFHDVHPITRLLSVQAWWGAAVVALLAMLAWRVRRASPLASFGIWWFFMLLVPSSVLVVLNQGEGMAEHRVYLASCGLFLTAGAAAGAIAAGLASMPRRTQWIAGAVLTATVLALSGRTVLRNAMWSDPVRLWREAAERAPANPLPWTVLGESLQMDNRPTSAIEAYRTALRLDPTDEAVYLKLGLCLAELGRFDDARENFEALRQVKPNSPFVATGLGVVAMLMGHVEEARGQLRSAIDRNPSDLMARRWLAVLEEDFAANPAEALRQCEEIRRIAPGGLSDDECVSRNRARLAAISAGSH